jgi:hypothetical protein
VSPAELSNRVLTYGELDERSNRIATPREAAFVVNDADAKMLVVGEEMIPIPTAMHGELTTVKKVLVVTSTTG